MFVRPRPAQRDGRRRQAYEDWWKLRSGFSG